MSSYASNITVPDMAKRILAGNRIAITTHQKPDGDAMGSILALGRALAAKGKSIDLFVMGPVQDNMILLAGQTPFQRVETKPPGDDYDLIIVCDTGAWAQVEPLAPWLKRHHAHVLGIDHHSQGEDLAAFRIVEPKSVATAAVLVPILDEMKCELTAGAAVNHEGVAEALFAGLATDCGWFRFENAGPSAFSLAARLLSCGVNKSRLYEMLEETYRPQRLAIEARALTSLEFTRGGTVAIQSLRMEDFQITGATLEDVSGLVNTPMSVGAVRLSILLTQVEPGVTKISFRSKPAISGQHAAVGTHSHVPNPQSTFFDVNQLAAKFGGGGHIHAAGARVKLEIDAAKARVIETVNAA